MAERYDRVAQVLHWLIALLIPVLWLMGENIDNVPRGPERTAFINLHISIGIIFALAVVLRLYWRFTHTPPAPLPASRPQIVLATAVQHTLYLLMVIIPVLGIAARFTHGRDIAIFGMLTIPTPFAEDRSLFKPLENIHGLVGTILISLSLLHAALALIRHFVLKDGLLNRMSPFAR